MTITVNAATSQAHGNLAGSAGIRGGISLAYALTAEVGSVARGA